MSRLGFKSVTVYHGETFLGEMRAVPVSKDANSSFSFPNNRIRISQISPPSERSPPLSVLQTISSYSVRCKLESPVPPEQQPNLLTLHATCFYERKTAVVVLGNEEMHLVAMPSKEKNFPCFWCCSVRAGLYNSCLGMLNLRCLAIVFDLDETLIVANTMRSFEDRMEFLRSWITRETDAVRAAGMSAELRRVSDDRALLRQYVDYDCVTDGGMVHKAQLEEVPQYSESHEKIVRPIIRLPEKNIVLTRINPEIRDTSVLVRLRPAWEDLRSYLTARGRKRFEVFVCTMAERDYAMEIWRLLDPDANLINLKHRLGRVVCVKSGSKKSLLNVFQDGICHPNLAMVIDDRMNVWEDKDQSRVHQVPAFAPYYAPQAETANAVPVLCVARNVACNIRGGFFKEFDENIHQRICDLFYEDEISILPPPPDVSNFLMIEDTGSVPNGNGNFSVPDGMYGADVESRLHLQDKKVAVDSAINTMSNVPEVKPEIARLPPVSASNVAPPYSRTPMPILKSSLLGVPGKRDGFSSESDIDKRRRLSMMQHGGDARTPICGDPAILTLPARIPSVPSHSQGGWLVEEDLNKGQFNNQPSPVTQDSTMLKAEKRVYPNTVVPSLMPPGQVFNVPRGKHEVGIRHERPKQILPANLIPVGRTSDVAFSPNQVSSYKEFQADVSKANALKSSLSISVLQEIGRRCNSKVEFRSVVSTRQDLQFSIEVLFAGEKIGVGMGKIRKDAQQQAAENALRSLADKYVEYVGQSSGTDVKNFDMHSNGKENGFIWDDVNTEPGNPSTEENFPKESTSEATEMAVESSSSMANQHMLEHSSSSRLQKTISGKLLRDEVGSQSILSSLRPQKNGRPT